MNIVIRQIACGFSPIATLMDYSINFQINEILIDGLNLTPVNIRFGIRRQAVRD